ncbi:hypothetical protein [Ruegeria sp. R14_0]|uniref:hypothetical protein n=1 Tax=Ruegeria sp. R14_0 TaxID=2821100 RepID=UPI001ADC25BB|nr:hypothetical protein [Ruegeria sp. R14_0]MBO9447207.1 hypothetical protein [Ruegeria sp. R14_0]
MKVLIHQGFHKTGTTTLQKTLEKNQDTLRDQVNILLPNDLQGVSLAARRYAIVPKERTLQNFGLRMRQALLPFDGAGDKPLLISNEELSGLIPGRKGVWTYAQTHVLSRVLLNEVLRLTGGTDRIIFLFTTRTAEEWIKSTYWQNLRSHRIREDLEQYGQQLQRGADLEAVVARVTDAVSPQAEVQAINVSAHGARDMPLLKALSTVNVRSDHLRWIEDRNVQPEGSAEYFLKLNRSDMSDADVSAAKRAYLSGLKR